MIEITENDTPRNFDSEVDKACSVLLADFKTFKRDFAQIGCTEARYHDSPAFNVDVLIETANRFKAKGYFARWNRNVTGNRYGLTIAKYASNNDF